MRYYKVYLSSKSRRLLPSRYACHLPPGGRLFVSSIITQIGRENKFSADIYMCIRRGDLRSPAGERSSPLRQKDRERAFSVLFLHILPARYSVLHLFGVLSGGNIAFLREEGGTRSVTEGARVTLALHRFYCNALSLTRLRRELPPGGSLWVVSPKVYLLFLTSTAFVDTKAIYYDWFIIVCPIL